MRTTVDLPDDLYRELKAKAALEGCSVKNLLVRLLEREITSPRKKGRIRVPLIRSQQPGTLALTNEQIDDILFTGR